MSINIYIYIYIYICIYNKSHATTKNILTETQMSHNMQLCITGKMTGTFNHNIAQSLGINMQNVWARVKGLSCSSCLNVWLICKNQVFLELHTTDQTHIFFTKTE